MKKELKFYVYRYCFEERMSKNIVPYYYIGSKSKGYVENGKLYDKHGKQYRGSSCYKLYSELWDVEEPKLEILYEGIDSSDILRKEIDLCIENSVNISSEYFNMVIPPFNNFTFCDHKTFRHKDTGVHKRLPINHELVLNGTFISSLIYYYKTHDNHFKGKKHTEKSLEKMRKSQRKYYDEHPEVIEKLRDEAKIRFSGRKHSPDHSRKIGEKSKGLVTFKNKITGEKIRLHKTDPNYEIIKNDKNWGNMYSLRKKGEIISCPHCGKTGENNNASFLKWHFKNCRNKKDTIKENTNEN